MAKGAAAAGSAKPDLHRRVNGVIFLKGVLFDEASITHKPALHRSGRHNSTTTTDAPTFLLFCVFQTSLGNTKDCLCLDLQVSSLCDVIDVR